MTKVKKIGVLFSFQIPTKRIKNQKRKPTTEGINSNFLAKLFTKLHKGKGLPPDGSAAR